MVTSEAPRPAGAAAGIGEVDARQTSTTYSANGSPLSPHLHNGESDINNDIVENAIRLSCIGKGIGCLSGTRMPTSAQSSSVR